MEEEIKKEAEYAKQAIGRSDSIELRDQIAKTAKYSGYFDIWENVFKDDQDMLRRFSYTKRNKGE